MNINPSYLEISFEKSGIRNSQKRLKELISEVAIEPLKEYQDDLQHKLSLVEEIVTRRVAKTIIYWLQHKSDPVRAESGDMMSSITNASRNDMTLEDFYFTEVRNGIHSLAPLLGLEVPVPYEIESEELEYALIELEDTFEEFDYEDDYNDDDIYEADYQASNQSFSNTAQTYSTPQREAVASVESYPSLTDVRSGKADKTSSQKQAVAETVQEDKSIVLTQQTIEPTQEQQIDINVLDMTTERAWQLTYDLIGFNTEYVQGQMLPRWVQNPESFEKDRRFLYQTFIDAIRSAVGVQIVAGNHRFADRPMTVDQMWNYYFTDLSRNVGPLLTAAKLDAAVNDPWYTRWWKYINTEGRKISPVWMMALVIALVFDGLTTYVSLDQTPMEGFMVLVFTGLITILFQIADILVIDYRKREFEADALVAKYKALFERYTTTISTLDTTSESYVQLSMKKSQAVADWKASEDNRKMARRGRFWSARIADINVIVTAYGFAYMFLNAEEPIYALYQQINFISLGAWEQLNFWVFLMIGLAVTVSFVINTAQRTEVLGWSMRRLKNEPT
ncbi:MAG: hypothetical protein Phog2KO_30490 [Phototrophicaceae bacterium]